MWRSWAYGTPQNHTASNGTKYFLINPGRRMDGVPPYRHKRTQHPRIQIHHRRLALSINSKLIMGSRRSQQATLPRKAKHRSSLWYCLTHVDDKWNMDKITLTLFVANGKNSPDSNYYVIGDILELGDWQ